LTEPRSAFLGPNPLLAVEGTLIHNDPHKSPTHSELRRLELAL